MMNGTEGRFVRRPRNGSAARANGTTRSRAAPDDSPDEAPLDDAAIDAGAESDDLCEIEHEGCVYKVPKALKGAFLRQQDYTKKTQDIARQRRTLERARAALSAQLVAQQEHVRDIAALIQLDEQLQALGRTNWPMLRQQNPQGAAALAQRALQLSQLRGAVAAKLLEKIRARALLARGTEAKKVADAEKQLRRDIKGWNGDLARRLRDYGVSLGFSPQEIAAVTDPRIVKALHRAFTSEQAKTASAPPPAEAMRPLSQVGRRSSPTEIELSEDMPVEDWIRLRNLQVRQRRGY